MDPVMISANRYEFGGQLWISPLRLFDMQKGEDKAVYDLWRAHYKALDIQVQMVPNGKLQMLLVLESDDQKVWPRSYSWAGRRR